MNYYQHHIGDFNNATRCLTRVERSVYRDLIELYYDKEGPLSGNIKFLQKLVLAVSDEEKEALNTVLEMFFTYEDDQFRNSRCDSEIEKYQSNQSAKARAGRMSAAKRKRNSTRVEQVNNECATNQEPITSNQEPIIKDILSPSVDSPQKIVDQYNRIVTEQKPNWQKCTALTAKRKTMVKSALKLVEPRAKLIGETPAQYLERLLEAMANDADFFSGWPNQRNQSGFNCSFDTNFRQERIAQAIDKFAGAQ